MQTKKAKQLTEGDKIRLEDNSVVRVNSVTRGFVRYESGPATMINHSAGWSQVPSDSEVTLA